MKKIITMLGLAVALIASAFTAQAQSTDIQVTALSGGTNNIAATTTNTAAKASFSVTRSTVMGLQLSCKLTGAGTETITQYLDSSMDNVNWTTNTHVVVLTAAGTTTASGYTNITVGALPFFRPGEQRNPSASAVTNLTLKVISKPGL